MPPFDLTQPIDIQSVNNTAKKYDTKIKTLDLLDANEILQYFQLYLGVKDSIVITTNEDGEISKKYDGNFTGGKKVGTLVPRTLKVYPIVAEMKDEPEKYRRSFINDVRGEVGLTDDAFYLWLINQGIGVASEELYNAIWSAKLTSGTGIMNSFDGVDELIKQEIIGGGFSVGKKNLYVSGGAYTASNIGDKLLAQWRMCPSVLKRKGADMYISENMGEMYDDWYKSEHEMPPNVDVSGQEFLDSTNKKCRLIRQANIPSGSQRVVISAPLNILYGVDKLSDMKTMKAFASGSPYHFTAAMKYVFGVQFASVNCKKMVVNDDPGAGSGSGS
jgi:hypothetical protein